MFLNEPTNLCGWKTVSSFDTKCRDQETCYILVFFSTTAVESLVTLVRKSDMTHIAAELFCNYLKTIVLLNMFFNWLSFNDVTSVSVR